MTSSTSRLAEPLWRRLWAGLRFWAALLYETATRQRLGRVLRGQLAGAPISVSGREALPTQGPFVLAVNHLRAGQTPAVVAAVLCAAAQARPGVEDECVLIIGQRPPREGAPRWVLALRRLVLAVFSRWERNVLRIPMGNGQSQLTALRAFRQRAEAGPVLVFPEGQVSLEFGAVRRGAGRWLGALEAPTVPVGIWHEGAGWHVTFGAPLSWSCRSELHDLQLGLAIAALLPPALAPGWQELLGRWRAAHAPGEARTG